MADRSFAVSVPEGAISSVRKYLGAFELPAGGASSWLHLEWDDGVPTGAERLLSHDGAYMGWSTPAGDGLRVGMSTPGSVGRGIALLLSHAFAPPEHLLLHGAGVRIGRVACLALGSSGAGKSTFSTLFEEAELLSDETVLVELGPPALHATPIHSSSPRAIAPGPAELRAIIALDKSPDVSLEPLPEGAAVRLILDQCLTHDPARVLALFEAATSLVRKVPRYTLHFRKDRDFVPLLMDLLK